MTLPRSDRDATYPVGMDETDEAADPRSDLLSTLDVIEDQPLAARAAAYESIHDTLARRLDSGPANPPRS